MTAERIQTDPKKTILVVGGGISGMTVAIEATEAGYDAVLVEKNPYLGGRVVQLFKYFPKLCPPTCGLEINLQRIRTNTRLRLFFQAEVDQVAGGPGNFTATIKTKPRYVNDRCTACDECVRVCPVERPNAFNFGMDKTKAIFYPFPMAYPMRYVIDDSACQKEKCNKCVEVCRYNAIDLGDQPKTVEIRVGSIVLATGWDPYDAAKMDNLGYGKFPNVITNMEFERIASPNGPTRGEMTRISDGKPIRRIAFIQCAGSRDENHLAFCSTICCLGTLKQTTYLREKVADSKAFMFYIDVRTPGKFEPFCAKTSSADGVTMVKGKVAKITEDPATRDLTVEAEQMLTGEKVRVGVDLVVLATGMNPSAAAAGIPVPISYDDYHFAVEPETDTGIHVVGCAKRPVDVATAIQDATGTALKAIQSIVRS